MTTARYTIYEDRIDQNARDLKHAFRNLRFMPAYSVKTNFTPMILKRFHENGFLIEVVSDMEVEIACAAGVPLKDIVYNGPLKGDLASAVARGGGILIFDSAEDLLQRQYDPGTRCMFRVAVNIGNGVDTRFGSHPKVISKLICEAMSLGYDPVGIHCHVTKGRDLASWTERIKIMARVYDVVHELLSEKIVDFGGNMYSPMPKEKADSYDDYASYREYAELFEQALPLFEGATIMLETGTSVVANCMDFAVDVLGIKDTDENTYVLLDCSKYHLGWATERYNFPVEVIHSNLAVRRREVTDAYFVGRLCTEGDVLYTGFSGIIGVGDTILFKNVGAYTIGVKPPFIVTHAPAWYVHSNGDKTLVKVEETSSHVMSTFVRR